VGGDVFGDALAAAQSGGDQVEGVAAVDLGTGRAPGGAAVVAADQEITGREAGGVEVVEDVADLAGAGVHGAVAVEADRVRAAAEAGELAQECGHGAEGGQFAEFVEQGPSGAGDDGFLLLVRLEGDGPRVGGCLAVSRPPRGSGASAAVLVAEQRAQDHGGDGHGDGRDGDGGQERGQHDAADEDGRDRSGADGDLRGRPPSRGLVGHGVGVRGRRCRAVGVLGEGHGEALLIYSSSHVSR
jgi:hypothetical protein